MKNVKITCRIGSLELKSCNENLLSSAEEHTTCNILQYEEAGNCFTIGYWVSGLTGYEFKFAGDRPLSDKVNKDVLFALVKIGQSFLDFQFALKV